MCKGFDEATVQIGKTCAIKDRRTHLDIGPKGHFGRDPPICGYNHPTLDLAGPPSHPHTVTLAPWSTPWSRSPLVSILCGFEVGALVGAREGGSSKVNKEEAKQ